MADLYLGERDQLPEFLHQMITASGAPENLASKDVRFLLRRTNRLTKERSWIVEDGAASVSAVDNTGQAVTAADGWAKYALTPEQAAQLVASDLYVYELRWRVLTAGRPMSFPNDRWLSLHVS